MKLLIIDDDSNIINALAHALSSDNIVLSAQSGAHGLQRAANHSLDVIILDTNLPDMSALSVCRTLRATGNKTPILVLLTESRLLSKIELLDAGADDYLTKPFRLGELQARLRALERRSKLSTGPRESLIQVGGLSLDTVNYQAHSNDYVISLRRKEAAILECLMNRPGTAISRSSLTKKVWKNNSPTTNSLEVHIKSLRNKLEGRFNGYSIKTYYGYGYELTYQKPSNTDS